MPVAKPPVFKYDKEKRLHRLSGLLHEFCDTRAENKSTEMAKQFGGIQTQVIAHVSGLTRAICDSPCAFLHLRDPVACPPKASPGAVVLAICVCCQTLQARLHWTWNCADSLGTTLHTTVISSLQWPYQQPRRQLRPCPAQTTCAEKALQFPTAKTNGSVPGMPVLSQYSVVIMDSAKGKHLHL